MRKSSFQALAFIPRAANFLVRVNLISRGIKGSRRCEETRKKHGVTFQVAVQFFLKLGLQPALHLPKHLLEKVSKGTFSFALLNPHSAK